MSLYVSVGHDRDESDGYGYIYTSSDGIEWTLTLERGNEDFEGFYDVANDGNMWVVVGNTGIITSTDGLTWSASINTDTNDDAISDLRAVHYAHGLWLAGGNGGNLYSSPDGLEWTFIATGAEFYTEGADIRTISAHVNGWYVGGSQGTSYSGWYANHTPPTTWQGFLLVGVPPDTDGDMTVIYDITSEEDAGIGDALYGGQFNGLFTGLGDGLARFDEINNFADTDPGGDFDNAHIYGMAYSETLQRWVFAAGPRPYYADGSNGIGGISGFDYGIAPYQDDVRGVVWSDCDEQFVYVGTGDTYQ